MVAVPFHDLGIRAIRLVDAEPAVLTLVWPRGGATPLVAELAEMARRMYEPDAPAAPAAPA